MRKKLDFISLAYIFGAICIVFVHSIPFLYVNPPHIFLAFKTLLANTFILPMFFFCAGFLLKYNNSIEKKKLKKYYFDKIEKLLIPYICIYLLGFLLSYFFDNFNVKNIFINLLYPRRTGHLWFLPILFYFYAIWPLFNFLINKANNNLSIYLSIIALFVILSYCPFASLKETIFAYSDFCVWGIHFALGFVLCDLIINNLDKWSNIISIGICLLLIILSLIFYRYIENKIFIYVFLLVQFLLMICYRCSNLINIKLFKLFYGKYFTIYLFHFMFIYILSKLFETFLNYNFYLSVLFLWVSTIILCLLLIELLNKMNIKNKYVRSIFGL